MRKRFYEAFTLVEMLIVMGILIILMVIGVTAGRFAINRANDVAHQNAVDQIYMGLQAYYTDERVFPSDCGGGTCTVDLLIGDVGDDTAPLNQYLDSGAFNGGTEATYYYFVEGDTQQSVLVCVSLGGADDERERGVYCNGNGFGDADLDIGATATGSDITEKSVPFADAGIYQAIIGVAGADWDGNAWE